MGDDILIQALVNDAVNKAIQHYGIEGSIQVIEEVYQCMPEVKKALLNNIKDRLKK